ncbi:hypothetical protein DRJ12_00785, partial [Candidatus Acetothermia bacterium]
DYLIDAKDRGVRVRVLLDQSDWSPSITAKNRPTIDYLKSEGIEARFDDPGVTTHAKLVIVDRREVILGSTNWNKYALTDQEQTDIRIEDERVGEAFASYFDRLWDGDFEGNRMTFSLEVPEDNIPTIVPLPDGNGLTVYASFLLDLIPQATSSVHVLLYRMSYYAGYRDSTTNALLDALIAASSRGLDVRVLLDDCSYYPESAQANLAAAIYLSAHGIEVRFDSPNQTTHAKLVLTDGKDVVLGSTNWNYYSIEKDVEADVALLNIPDVASVYEAYFEALFDAGRPISP